MNTYTFGPCQFNADAALGNLPVKDYKPCQSPLSRASPRSLRNSPRPRRRRQPILQKQPKLARCALTGLFSSIKSGYTSDAKKSLPKVEKLTNSNTSSTTSSNNPRSEFLSRVCTALSDNNIAGAQSALTTLKTYAISSTSASTSTSANSSTATGSSSNPGISPIGQDLLNLFSAISSGNLTSAQSAYDSLTGLLNSTDNSSSSSASTSSTGTASNSSPTSFSSVLSQIGSALSSGNVNSAQPALDSFLSDLSSGSLVNATA